MLVAYCNLQWVRQPNFKLAFLLKCVWAFPGTTLLSLDSIWLRNSSHYIWLHEQTWTFEQGFAPNVLEGVDLTYYLIGPLASKAMSLALKTYHFILLPRRLWEKLFCRTSQRANLINWIQLLLILLSDWLRNCLKGACDWFLLKTSYLKSAFEFSRERKDQYRRCCDTVLKECSDIHRRKAVSNWGLKPLW